MIRTPIALVPYVVLAAVLIGGLLWQKGNEMVARQTTLSGEAQIGGPFALTDQNGQVKTQADFRGRYMLVYFGYTYCPDVCPLTIGVMADALHAYAKKGGNSAMITPVFVTVDPARDTAPVLKSYLEGFGKNWVGLTGDEASVARTAKVFRVYFKKQPLPNGAGYAMDHSNTIYLMGPDGRFVTHYDESMGFEALAADLKKRV